MLYKEINKEVDRIFLNSSKGAEEVSNTLFYKINTADKLNSKNDIVKLNTDINLTVNLNQKLQKNKTDLEKLKELKLNDDLYGLTLIKNNGQVYIIKGNTQLNLRFNKKIVETYI